MKNNLAITGYHILLILSSVDGQNDPSEKTVIQSFLMKQFPLEIDPIEEAVFLDTISRGNFEEVFESAALEFYTDSTPEQRTLMLNFADQLINADNRITPEENNYFEKLRGYWKADVNQPI